MWGHRCRARVRGCAEDPTNHAILRPERTDIAATELPTVLSHLDLALRHLEDASALAATLNEDDELTGLERFVLNDDAAEAGLLIERLTRTIAGPTLDEELARFLYVVE